METAIAVTLALVVFALAANAVFLYAIARRRKPEEGTLLIQREIQELARGLNERLGETSRQVHDSVRAQLSESSRLIREITEELTHVKTTGKRVEGFAEQLQNLQDILKNPKQRGILGEYYLETLLKNVLPAGSYRMQYAFADGTVVDAAVFVRDKIIPIDSKFSLENYNKLAEERDPAERERLERAFKQDLKNRIDETAKYVKPAEGTMDFAFMFIPHEAIYYDLLVSQVGAAKVNTRDLIEYAFRDRKVIIVSPTSFLAYLQTVLQGLKALEIEERVGEVVKRVGELGRHLRAFDDYHEKLGNALATTVGHYNASRKELRKVDKDVLRIAGEGAGLAEIPAIERPERGE